MFFVLCARLRLTFIILSLDRDPNSNVSISSHAEGRYNLLCDRSGGTPVEILDVILQKCSTLSYSTMKIHAVE